MEKIKRKDGSFRYRESIYINNTKQVSPWFTKITDAKKWKSRLETERLSRLALGNHYQSSLDINFKEYANQWLETHVKANCVLKTQQSYESIIRNHLIPRFGKFDLKSIDETASLKFMSDLKSKHNPKGTSNIWCVFRGIILSAKKNKLIFFNPLENIKLPKPDLREDNFWIKDELTQFLRINATDQLYPFYFVAIHSGMRLAELCGLKYDRIDFRLNQISVTRTRDKLGLKETTKTKLKRIIPMTAEVKSMLLAMANKRKEHGFVFIESNGEPIKYGHIYRRFHKAQKNAGIYNQIRFHDLRHSFASNYMMNGGNLFELQKILGHTKIDMTMRYAHFSPSHLQNSLQFMTMTKTNEENEDRTVLEPQTINEKESLVMLRA